MKKILCILVDPVQVLHKVAVSIKVSLKAKEAREEDKEEKIYLVWRFLVEENTLDSD
jgi:hypothetical protein